MVGGGCLWGVRAGGLRFGGLSGVPIGWVNLTWPRGAEADSSDRRNTEGIRRLRWDKCNGVVAGRLRPRSEPSRPADLPAGCPTCPDRGATARPAYLSIEERTLIADLRRRGDGVRAIVRQLGRPASTVSRELRRNRDEQGRYRPHATPSGSAAAPQPQHQLARTEAHGGHRGPGKVQHLVQCRCDAHVSDPCARQPSTAPNVGPWNVRVICTPKPGVITHRRKRFAFEPGSTDPRKAEENRFGDCHHRYPLASATVRMRMIVNRSTPCRRQPGDRSCCPH